ncbi:MAG: type II toxin-antitoxin system RelB/DinJ family antitoxin [Clostridia bacterium]|jgi:addiction module RelB/DinJ family antitoxin|nr:type II toxin-antitoxin system RelB/DinJ family antitoxin [Clostridia bacterium]
MSKLEIEIDDRIYNEAEEILKAIGMDVSQAVNILLRRVVIEKGLPITMTVAPRVQINQSAIMEDSTRDESERYTMRTNKAITKEMLDELWEAFIKHHNGMREIRELSYEVSDKSGMNQGSAFIYLNILTNLVSGKMNKRTLKMSDLEYLMEKIKSDLGTSKYYESIKSLRVSVPYWEQMLNGNFAKKVTNYCNLHEPI